MPCEYKFQNSTYAIFTSFLEDPFFYGDFCEAIYPVKA